MHCLENREVAEKHNLITPATFNLYDSDDESIFDPATLLRFDPKEHLQPLGVQFDLVRRELDHAYTMFESMRGIMQHDSKYHRNPGIAKRRVEKDESEIVAESCCNEITFVAETECKDFGLY